MHDEFTTFRVILCPGHSPIILDSHRTYSILYLKYTCFLIGREARIRTPSLLRPIEAWVTTGLDPREVLVDDYRCKFGAEPERFVDSSGRMQTKSMVPI